MLTPYEFGKETGRLQAQVHTEISEERIEHLAHILGIEEKVSFSEGYRNGFTASRKLAEELGDIEPSDEELDAIEAGIPPCEECIEGMGMYLHTCQEIDEIDDETPPWLPSPAELEAAEAELAAKEIEEGQRAYREMVEDEYPIRYSIFSWLRP